MAYEKSTLCTVEADPEFYYRREDTHNEKTLDILQKAIPEAQREQ